MPQTIVITGASDGIGAAAVRYLARQGERVVLVGRSHERTRELALELEAPFHLADFGDLNQVRILAAELETYTSIDVLANNAGGIMGNRRLSSDGFELTFQVNHLAPFLLTNLLMPRLVESQAKVIQSASSAAKVYGDLDLDDLQSADDYSPQKAYGNAKLANILFTRELHRRFGPHGLAAVAFHPGVVGTSFARDTTHFMRFVYHAPVVKKLFTLSPDQGAAHLTWLVEGTPMKTWTPGEYYEKNARATRKSSPQVHDADLARRLWDRSAEMLGL